MNSAGYAQELEGLVKTADEYYEKEQYHTAAQYYQVAVGLEQNKPDLLYRLAQSYRAIFDYNLAASYYQKLLELDRSSYPLAPFYLAQMHKSMGNFKKARDGFEEFVKSNTQTSALPPDQAGNLLKQAEIEIEGCLWAIEQLGKSWTEMGFALMPEPINSASNDYAAVTTGDDQVITITSGKKGAKGGLVDNRFGEYFTDNFRYRHGGNQWVQEETTDHFDRTNTKFSDGVGTYNSRGDKYYFTSCYEGNAFCKLYVTYKENGVWKNPELLNEHVNAPGYDNKHPTLTAGGDTLIFVSNRPGGAGGNDLWFSVSAGGESWRQARPLPGHINTPFNEASPFRHSGNLLFFSSDGHFGMGGMDIFMSENYLDQESKVQNLGTPFNSGYDDSFFSLGSGKGYVSSNRPYGPGKFDIYSFNLPREKNDLAQYLEETAEGTQLRSRIRDSDGGNLYASRDEDQFYYDNLTAEERARLDRILSLKQEAEGTFDPSLLSKEDYKYYKKLDVSTKATIERLAQKRILTLEGQALNSMTRQEKLDWEFYQNIDTVERSIIDRIIDIKVEARRRALAGLSQEEIKYTRDPSNYERIESKLQLQSLNSLSAAISEQQQEAALKLSQNEQESKLGDSRVTLTKSQKEMAGASIQNYQAAVEQLSQSLQLFYDQLTPKEKDDLYQAAVRSYVLTASSLTQDQKQRLLSELGLESNNPGQPPTELSLNEAEMWLQLRDVITEQIKMGSSGSNAPVEELATNELKVQQFMLSHQQELLRKKDADTRKLQDQIKKYLAEQDKVANNDLEDKIVENYLNQAALLFPLLTPKESYYFNGLNPGHQLRLERLVSMVEVQTRELQTPSQAQKQYLADQTASDQWYYQELTSQQQEIIDHLVAQGWTLEEHTNTDQLEFIANLDVQERNRIDRMMGNLPKLNLEIQGNNRGVIARTNTADKGEPAQFNRYQPPADPKATFTRNLPSVADSQVPGHETSYLGGQIYFDFDQYSLRKEAKRVLSELMEFLSAQDEPVEVIIEGHTDNIGSSAHNKRLSEMRSLSTAEFLQPSSGRVEVSTRSYGEERPATANSNAFGRQLNRRVELKIQGVQYESSLQTFIVRPNVTLEMILEATGLLKEDVMKWNGLENTQLKRYQPLRLPTDLDFNSIKHLLYRGAKYKPISVNANFHLVQTGENLFRLSLRYNTTVEVLEDLNNITASELLAGQQIRVR